MRVNMPLTRRVKGSNSKNVISKLPAEVAEFLDESSKERISWLV
jgi:hypothetical protein